MTGQLGNWLWSACSKTESDFCPSKGRFFIAFPKYLAHKNNCTCIGRVMSCPVVLIKDGLLQLHKSCSILCSHWNFFSSMCLMGSAHDPVAEREWRCHCQLTDPNGLCESVTLKSCCTLHCSDLAGDSLGAGEFQCSIYLTKIGEKVCAAFTEVSF